MASDNERSDGSSVDSSGKQFQREDLLQYSNIFASEFNNSALSDRILVIKVIERDRDIKAPDILQYSKAKATEDTLVISEEENEKVSK